MALNAFTSIKYVKNYIIAPNQKTLQKYHIYSMVYIVYRIPIMFELKVILFILSDDNHHGHPQQQGDHLHDALLKRCSLQQLRDNRHCCNVDETPGSERQCQTGSCFCGSTKQ